MQFCVIPKCIILIQIWCSTQSLLSIVVKCDRICKPPYWKALPGTNTASRTKGQAYEKDMHCVSDNTKGNQYCFGALIVSLDFVFRAVSRFQC